MTWEEYLAVICGALLIATLSGCDSSRQPEENAGPISLQSRAAEDDDAADLIRTTIRHVSENAYRTVPRAYPGDALFIDPALLDSTSSQRTTKRIPPSVIEELKSSGIIAGSCGADCTPGDYQLKAILSLPYSRKGDASAVYMNVLLESVFPPSETFREGVWHVTGYDYKLVRKRERWRVESREAHYFGHGPYPY